MRPTDEYQLKMTVDRVTANPTLTDDQFQVETIPDTFKKQELK